MSEPIRVCKYRATASPPPRPECVEGVLPMPRSLPEDPIIRGLVQQARRAQLTRRSMLGVTGGAAAALALAACAPGGAGKPSPAKDLSDTEKKLIWANWPAYLDEDDDGNYPTLERFIDQSGIQVDYRVDV